MKNNQKKSFNITPAIMILFLLVGMYFNQEHISSQRKLSQTSSTGKIQKTLPPSLALITIAFGPLRGLIANAVWWRIIEQQDQGNFFEINQLADWITVMQPRNAKVWTYQAWNLAYNVSLEFPGKESKWKWIYRGLDLLTNQALKYNPDNQNIKDEIARIFFERIGYESDADIKYYQEQWAALVYPYVPNGSRKELKTLASAPQTEQELRKSPEVTALLDKAQKLGLNLLSPKVFYSFSQWTPAQQALIKKNKKHLAPMTIIDSYLKSKQLKDKFNLDPKRMLYIDEQYGPLDWRLYQAYAIYWSSTVSFDQYLKEPLQFQPTVRRAMQNSFLDGKLIYKPKSGLFITTNNLRIIGKLHDYYDHLLENNYSQQADMMHKEFLIRASAILYTFNEIEAAKEVYHHYYEDYEKGQKPNFERFIAQNLYKTLHQTTYKTKKSLIESALYQAYNWMGVGDMKRALGYANFARMTWQRNQRLQKNNPARLLPPFDTLKAAAYHKMMSSSAGQQFKDNINKASSNQEFDKVDLEKTYLGQSIESGEGHGVFRKEQDKKQKQEERK